MNEAARRSIRAAIAVMAGRRDALGAFDLSADGFWGSFLAIAIAVPALAIGWVTMARRAAELPDAIAFDRLLAAYAFTDLAAWIVPLALFALAAKPFGLGDRFVPYTVVTNWGSVPIVWLMLPGALVDYFLPSDSAAGGFLSFVSFGLALALTWRMTEISVDRGPWIGTAVFVAMFVTGMGTLAVMQAILGV